MSWLKRLIIDVYSGLSHKQAMDDRGVGDVASWVPVDHRRRLAAYRVLSAYMANVARQLLGAKGSEDPEQHREYGEARLLVDRIRSGVLGESWEIVVEGADADLPDEPAVEPPLEPLPAESDSIARKIWQVRQTQRLIQGTVVVDEWAAAVKAQPALRERQQALRAWADGELLAPKLVRGETDTVGLGDGVYVLWPGGTGEWPKVWVYDPGAFFPMGDGAGDEFSTRVHLVWQFEVTGSDGRKRSLVRRLTWELVPLTWLRTHEFGDFARDQTGAPILGWQEVVTAEGQVYRAHPWDRDELGSRVAGAGSWETCVHTDATWEASDVGGKEVDDFDLGRASYIGHNRTDLFIDFLPVVHVPNTPTGEGLFGESCLSVVAQLLDDLAQVDTDLMEAARLTANPFFVASGVSLGEVIEVRPGTGFGLGPDGEMDVLDLSNGVTVLRGMREGLADLLFVNGRVPASLIGRVDGSTDVAGITVLLSFGPFTQLIGTLRMTREPKYRLLLRFAQRLAQVHGALPNGPTPDARIALGSYLPMDRGTVITEVTGLLTAKAISRRTGLALLVAAGIGIEDATAELDRIEREDFSGAVEIYDATGSRKAATDYLGLDVQADSVPPAPTKLPPGPNPTPPLPPTPTA